MPIEVEQEFFSGYGILYRNHPCSMLDYTIEGVFFQRKSTRNINCEKELVS